MRAAFTDHASHVLTWIDDNEPQLGGLIAAELQTIRVEVMSSGQLELTEIELEHQLLESCCSGYPQKVVLPCDG